jgi:ATP-binding cassette subfamily B protein
MMSAPKVKDRKGVLKRLWKYFNPYKWRLLGIVFMVCLTTGLGLLIPWVTGKAIDRYIGTHDLPGLARLICFMVGACVLAAIVTWVQSVQMIQITQLAVRDIRKELFDHFQTLSLRFFDRHPHGELMSRLSNDTETISTTLGDGITQFIGSALSIIGAGTIMFTLNWRLSLASMTTIPIILIVTKLLAGRSRQGFRDRQEKLGAMNGTVEETIQGQRVVKAFCREQETLEKLTTANVNLKKTAILATIFVGTMGPFMNLFRNIGFTVTAGVGGWMVVENMVTVGTVAAFISYADYFNRPIIQIANLYGMLQAGLAGAERVFAILDEVPEINDAPDAIELTDIQGRVEFDNVSFGYVPDVAVLSEVSFCAQAGQTIALVGPTGAGKTTIINLLTRFYDIDAGAIKVDGKDIRVLTKDSLRESLGIVLQDTYLFTGKVRENIRYGRLEASDSEVEDAARLANADSFIRHLPHGYDTVLSDAGGSLSQGQRQLLAIARALLADPAILILDEATSSVDTRTEVHIQQALHRLMCGRTSFIIAHRLSTIQQADCILVIDGGRIVERGTHSELLEKQGAYYNLYASQVESIKQSISISSI